jgi:hypothetical protein
MSFLLRTGTMSQIHRTYFCWLFRIQMNLHVPLTHNQIFKSNQNITTWLKEVLITVLNALFTLIKMHKRLNNLQKSEVENEKFPKWYNYQFYNTLYFVSRSFKVSTLVLLWLDNTLQGNELYDYSAFNCLDFSQLFCIFSKNKINEHNLGKVSSIQSKAELHYSLIICHL